MRSIREINPIDNIWVEGENFSLIYYTFPVLLLIQINTLCVVQAVQTGSNKFEFILFNVKTLRVTLS